MRIFYAFAASQIETLIGSASFTSYQDGIAEVLLTQQLFSNLGLDPQKILRHQDFLSIPNSTSLQRLWWKENRESRPLPAEHSWELDILVEQILGFQPDFVYSNNVPLSEKLANLQQVPVALWLAAPMGVHGLSEVAVGISFNEHYQKTLIRAGVSSTDCFDFHIDMTGRFRPSKSERPVDIGFYGRVSPMFRQRNLLLLELASRCSSEYRVVYCLFREPASLRRPFEAIRTGTTWIKLKKYSVPPVFGKDLWDYLARTKIVVNVHSDSTGARKGNMRTLEAIKGGAAVICDRGLYPKHLHKILEPWMFDDADEAASKALILLGNEALREEYVDRLQKVVATHYDASSGREKLEAILRKHLTD